jgi:hypothetical protein
MAVRIICPNCGAEISDQSELKVVMDPEDYIDDLEDTLKRTAPKTTTLRVIERPPIAAWKGASGDNGDNNKDRR